MENNVHRIQEVKFNFDTQTDEELTNIRGHLLDKHVKVVGEIALIETELFARANIELPLEQ